MKALPFKLIKTNNESFVVQVDEQAWFYDSFHQHPEIQIMYIEKGNGTVLAGDYIGNFAEGDLFIIGSNQPHVFRCSSEYYEKPDELNVRAISVFINKDIFGEEFIRLPELNHLRHFISETDFGFKVDEPIRFEVVGLMRGIVQQKGLSRIISLLRILKIMSEGSNIKILSNLKTDIINESDGERINLIYQFTLRNFKREIVLKEAASIANMTVTSFCRYFKKRTRKNYYSFLNEIRIGYACKLLTDSDSLISDISFRSGYNNLSFFNRKFKEIKGMTPREYQRNYALKDKRGLW